MADTTNPQQAYQYAQDTLQNLGGQAQQYLSNEVQYLLQNPNLISAIDPSGRFGNIKDQLTPAGGIDAGKTEKLKSEYLTNLLRQQSGWNDQNPLGVGVVPSDINPEALNAYLTKSLGSDPLQSQYQSYAEPWSSLQDYYKQNNDLIQAGKPSSDSGKGFMGLLESLLPMGLAFVPTVGPYLAAAASFGKSAAEGNPLGMGLSAAGAALAGAGDLGAFDTEGFTTEQLEEAAAQTQAAGGATYVDPTTGAPMSVPITGGQSQMGTYGGMSVPVTSMGSVDLSTGTVGGTPLSGASGISSQIQNLLGTGQDVSGGASALKNLISGQDLTGAANSLGTTYGTNIISGETGGGAVNTTGNWFDRQMYDQLSQIASAQSSGRITAQQADDMRRQLVAQQTGA